MRNNRSSSLELIATPAHPVLAVAPTLLALVLFFVFLTRRRRFFRRRWRFRGGFRFPSSLGRVERRLEVRCHVRVL